MIKFNKHNVKLGHLKARVHYSLDNRIDGRKCVTLFAKDYNDVIGKIFPTVRNDSDSREDYFEKDKVLIFEDSPYYVTARRRAEQNIKDREQG